MCQISRRSGRDHCGGSGTGDRLTLRRPARDARRTCASCVPQSLQRGAWARDSHPNETDEDSMTMPENLGHDPDRAGALRGAMVIVVVGVALGIGYNAMGLASRPRHGLAWLKQPEKIESLEALQGAPAPPSGAAETSMPAPGPGDAAAATME